MPHDTRLRATCSVLMAFGGLGLRSFGGPIAHLGYFRHEFVERRRWLADREFADLVALCQILPGPTSSQVGFALGLRHAGWLGALSAWIAFTAPSALVMLLIARGVSFAGGWSGEALLRGLNLAAVIVVAQAVASMARTLCPDRERVLIAALTMLVTLMLGAGRAQFVVIALGAVAGRLVCMQSEARMESRTPMAPRTGMQSQARASAPAFAPSRRDGALAAAFFLGLLAAAFAWPTRGGAAEPGALLAAMYRAGALVFGGGHVVLPVLRDALVGPGWVSEQRFLAGYGAAQAIPGPLFSVGAYLGAIVLAPPGQLQAVSLPGAGIGLLGLNLPGMLILVAALPYWQALSARTDLRASIRGINAAVVGLLTAALLDPVGRGAVHDALDGVLVIAGFLLMTRLKMPPLAIVALAVGACLLRAALR